MFTPRNINQRIKDYEIIKAKELNKYEDFFKEFEDNLKDIQNKTSSDLKEQLFIDLIKDCQIIKYQHETIKFRILLKIMVILYFYMIINLTGFYILKNLYGMFLNLNLTFNMKIL